VEISEKSIRLYYEIVKFMSENGQPPTVRELKSALGYGSVSTVIYHLHELKRAGLVVEINGGRRARSVLPKIIFEKIRAACELEKSRYGRAMGLE